MKVFFICFLLVLCQLYAAGTSKDSVFVSVQETDSSDIYTLYHRTNNSLRKIYEINTEDESSIEYKYRYKDNILDYDCISYWNNGGGCSQYIFFDHLTKIFYITKHCFIGFSIEKQSINFKDKTLILYGDKNTKDITDISSLDDFILYSGHPIRKRVLDKIVTFPDD